MMSFNVLGQFAPRYTLEYTGQLVSKETGISYFGCFIAYSGYNKGQELLQREDNRLMQTGIVQARNKL